MRFAFTEEQLLARDALRELLRAHCDAAQLRAAFEHGGEGAGTIPGLWSRLCEIGLIGALAPAAVGGSALSELDIVLMLIETGRAAVPAPVVDTAAVAVPLLAALPNDERARGALARVLEGEASVALGLARAHLGASQLAASSGSEPTSALVVNAGSAELLLIERAGELHLVERARAKLAHARSVDHTRVVTRVEFEPGADTCLARAELARDLLADAFERAALGTAAQLVGLGLRMLELTTTYVQTREQFGRPIGSFQAVKHQLVDAHLAVEFAEPLVVRAAHSLAHADPERALHVSMAKAFASDAALSAARKALQLHGAIGYSCEYALHLFMKRTWALAAAHGDALDHRKRIADITLGEPHA